jgi:hypothetical protein
MRRKNFLLISTALTALFVAVVLVVNVAFFALANHFVWYVDMTKHQLYTLSDTAKDILKAVDDKVTIYFAVEADKITQADPLLNYPYRTARDMEANFDNISVECVDIIKNPNVFKEFHTITGQDIKTTSVVIATESDFSIYYLESMFITDEDTGNLWGYQGEYKMISAILSLTNTERPKAYFTVNHGETNATNSQALRALYANAGYDVVDIDLTKEDLGDDARILIINDPKYDFDGGESGDEMSNEIAKIDRFLDDLGCLMVFTSPENAGRLTNLSELLVEWGIGFNGETYVQDKDHAISTDGSAIVAKYEENTLGASLYLDLDKNSKTILPHSMPLSILFEEDGRYEGTKEVSAVLSSHDSSVLYKDGKVVDEGSFPVMAISRELTVENNDYYYSYVFVSGSAEAASNAYLGATSVKYANKDIVYNTIKLTGKDRVLCDIEPKQFEKTALDITTAEANRWTVILTVVLPVIIAGVGTVVWVRRKNA